MLVLYRLQMNGMVVKSLFTGTGSRKKGTAVSLVPKDHWIGGFRRIGLLNLVCGYDEDGVVRMKNGKMVNLRNEVGLHAK